MEPQKIVRPSLLVKSTACTVLTKSCSGRGRRPGEQLPVHELTEKVREGLHQASERVRARYGFACTRADEEVRKLLETATGYDGQAVVRIRES